MSVECGTFVYFWLERARNVIVFRNEVLSIQRVEYFFIYLLWSETKMSVVDGPSTIVQFIDWVSCS